MVGFGHGEHAGARASQRFAECRIFGVLNVTPDSFSDGGTFLEADAAIARAESLFAEGAHVVDVGGESTRPAGNTYGEGAAPVSQEEELARVLPVVGALAARGFPVSVDTKKAEVAHRAIEAGAQFINDVSSTSEAALLDVVARSDVTLIRMHSRGVGEVRAPFTSYASLVDDVVTELAAEVERACDAGVPRTRVWIDPGLGFAKTPAQSLLLLRHVGCLAELDLPIMVGASRKSFLGHGASNPDGEVPPPEQRLGASVAAVLMAAAESAHAVRVHDVFETRQALLLWAALGEQRQSEAGRAVTP